MQSKVGMAQVVDCLQTAIQALSEASDGFYDAGGVANKQWSADLDEMLDWLAQHKKAAEAQLEDQARLEDRHAVG